MPNDKYPRELLSENQDPALYRLFNIDQEEFNERMYRGVDSALFKRWVLNEWADVSQGELELSSRREYKLRDIYREINDMKGVAAFISVAGSYLLEGTIPPCIA